MTHPKNYSSFFRTDTPPVDPSVDEAMDQDEAGDEYAYGRGRGIPNSLWDNISKQQQGAAADAQRTAAGLRAAAEALAANLDLRGDAKKAHERFREVMGFDAATPENMLRAAERLEQGSVVLRDGESYLARGVSGEKLIKNGASAETFMAVPRSNRREVWVNLDHDLLSSKVRFGMKRGEYERELNKRLRRALAHETFHSDVLGLRDQSDGHGQRAYRRGKDDRPTGAYERLKPEQALMNPDHLVSLFLW